MEFDEQAMRDLPVGKDPASTAQRKRLFRQADLSGNGIVSLAECDRLIVAVLRITGVKDMKPVINRAFHAARDIVPAVGAISPHYIDFHEFRYFLVYLSHYLELFLIFCACDDGADRRMSYDEFQRAIPKLLEWGLEPHIAKVVKARPDLVFQSIDADGGGVVLFDEFCHWALWNHIFHQDGEDDEDMEEALDVLRKQKPNLCGKDLSSIKASKARYRVDARISGQGCLGGDPSLKGGYDELDGGKELAAGGAYPGGLDDWQSSFHGGGQDHLGRYRCVSRVMMVSNTAEVKGTKKVGEIEAGTEFEVLEVDKRPQEKRIRARVADPEGWVSLLNTSNGFRWAVRLRGRPAIDRSKLVGDLSSLEGIDTVLAALGTGWKDSLARVREAGIAYDEKGGGLCVNGCGQPRFGRHPTCCTYCRGAEGPHAPSCVKTGYDPCVNGCGHPQFGKYDTCCWHCKGADGPHARDCCPMEQRGSQGGRQLHEGQSGASVPHEQRSRSSPDGLCGKGCGRARFRHYPTCCTHCMGPFGTHARDCDARVVCSTEGGESSGQKGVGKAAADAGQRQQGLPELQAAQASGSGSEAADVRGGPSGSRGHAASGSGYEASGRGRERGFSRGGYARQDK